MTAPEPAAELAAFTCTREQLARAFLAARWYGFASGEESLLAAAVAEHLPQEQPANATVSAANAGIAQLLLRIADAAGTVRALPAWEIDAMAREQLLALLDGGAQASPTSTPRDVT